MAKKHDESKDILAVSKVCKVDVYNKHISAPKVNNIGIRTWGRIDYLVNYCGWVFTYDNSARVIKVKTESNDNYKAHKREAKKAAKEQTLTNKKNKRNG